MRRLVADRSTTKPEIVKLVGGLDVVTPRHARTPGSLIDSLNFEQELLGGYRRVAGFERFDGRLAPSDASITSFSYTGTLAAGNDIVGNTSTATARVVYVVGGIAAITNVAGTFVDGETIKVGGSPVAVLTTLGDLGTAIDWLVTAQNAAADYYRSFITAVPGQGSVLGVFRLNGLVFAFRRNASTAVMDLYKSSTSGWTAVAMPSEISFTAGSSQYAEGSSLTKGGASATVRRVVLESGSWGAGTAAGRLIITGVTGGPFTAGVAGGGGVVTLSGAETAVSLTATGVTRVRVSFGNFGPGRRAFGADAVNRHWEFDGTYLVPISSPVSGQFPKFIAVHASHLFFSIGASLFNSGIGLPYSSQAIDGAAEQRAASTITGLLPLPGDQTTGALAVGSENETQVLYGKSSADFQLTSFQDSTGIVADSMQNIKGRAVALSDFGAISLSTAIQFGNFESTSISDQISRLIQSSKSSTVGSVHNKIKAQYRVYFSDGTGFYFTIGNGSKVIGIMPVILGILPNVISDGDGSSTTQQDLIGATNGFVYQTESGTSFDGEAIDYRVVFSRDFQRRPENLKHYANGFVDISGEGYVRLDVSYQFAGGDTWYAQGTETQEISFATEVGLWDDGGTWDDGGLWDSGGTEVLEFDISGEGPDISISFTGSDDRIPTFLIETMTLNLAIGRSQRT